MIYAHAGAPAPLSGCANTAPPACQKSELEDIISALGERCGYLASLTRQLSSIADRVIGHEPETPSKPQECCSEPGYSIGRLRVLAGAQHALLSKLEAQVRRLESL